MDTIAYIMQFTFNFIMYYEFSLGFVTFTLFDFFKYCVLIFLIAFFIWRIIFYAVEFFANGD